MFVGQSRHFPGLLTLLTTEALAAALADRYSIERLIGVGGMAKVFLARDLRYNRRVAVKVLRHELCGIVGLDRFQAEIKVTANLQHPNLLPLFDSGAAGDLLFYVMPYVEGESLRARLEREKQLPVDETVRIAAAIAGALDYAHRQGVVHRDLKPENILIQEGQPLVADFGIALAISNAGGGRLTETGLSLGTPRYMSPEQAAGDRAIDGRSDIYSLGAVTYEMLTGEPPHVGATAQAIIARVLSERPRSIRATRASVPAHLEAVVDRALEKLAADRWASARDFAEALNGERQVAASSSTLGLPSGRAVPSVREVAAWTVVAGLTIATSYFAFRAKRSVATPARTEFEVGLPDSLALSAAQSAALMTISRDGQTLVFVGQKGTEAQTRRLYLRRLSESFDLVHEIRGTEGALSPTLSPDGKEVLFAVADAAGGPIKRVDITGGVARPLTDSAIRNGQLSWREGNQVLMMRGQSLLVMDAATRTQRVLLKSDTSGRERYGFPDVLPGGKAALITIGSPQKLDSVTIGTVTIPEGRVTSLGIPGLSPRYSPTGHLIYGTEDGSLYAIRFDPRTLQVSGDPALIAEKVGRDRFGVVAFAVADNGTIAFIHGQLGAGVARPVIVSRSGKKRYISATPYVMGDPRISPDGRQIAFTKGEGLVIPGEFVKPDIWRFDLATGSPSRVTTDGASERPHWSRDGTELFFSKVPSDSVEYAIGLSAGAKPRVLFRGTGKLGTSDFSPQHGYAIIGVGSTGKSGSGDLWFAPIDSFDKARPLAAESYVEGFPRISPDGRIVAYQSFRTGTGEIYIRPISGNGEEIKVSSAGGIDPAWSHDGHELFFRADRQMMVARIATSPKLHALTPSQLFSLDGLIRSATRSAYDVFPNGEFLLTANRVDTASNKGHTPLVVRLNWAAALAERGARNR